MAKEKLRTTFTQAQIAQMVMDAQAALTGITEGPWTVRKHPMIRTSFVEAQEPPERRFGYAIEILGEDDNGYPTRERDVEFIAAARQLVPQMEQALKQLLAERRQKPKIKPE